MRLERIAAVQGLTVARIFDVPKLDPINVVLRDDGGSGQVIVECYGSAWATYFGAIGDSTLIGFVAGTHPDYLANRMSPPEAKREPKHISEYRRRVCTAVIEACQRMLINGDSYATRS